MKRENNSLKRVLVLIKTGVAMIIVLLAALVVVHYIKDKSFKASEANENELAGDIDEIPNGDDDYVEESVNVEVLPSDLFNASTVGENESITYGIDVSKHQGTLILMSPILGTTGRSPQRIYRQERKQIRM